MTLVTDVSHRFGMGWDGEGGRIARGTRTLDDGWASGNGVVVHGILASGEDDVGLAVDALRDLDREAAVDRGDIGEDGARHRDEGGVDGGVAVLRAEGVAGGQELDLVAALDGAGGAEGERGERPQRQLRLRGVGLRARHDEAGGEGVHLVEGQGRVEGLREGGLLVRGADVGAVARLDRQDGAGGREVCVGGSVAGSSSSRGAEGRGEVSEEKRREERKENTRRTVLVQDGGRRTEVRADAHALEHRGQRNERRGVGAGERVGALGDGGIGQSGGEERDVRRLVVGDLPQVVVEGVGEAGGHELGLRVVGQALAVELVLEVLEGQRVVEDAHVRDGGVGLPAAEDRVGRRDGGERAERAERDAVLHADGGMGPEPRDSQGQKSDLGEGLEMMTAEDAREDERESERNRGKDGILNMSP